MSGICKTCGEAIPVNAPLGGCPGCLLRRTLGEEERGLILAGPYRLTELIGEGSYGEVYIGEQTEPIRRDAAVKVLKNEFLASLVTERFAAEAQALSLLDHPNIARLHEAGTTGDGRPYLAMELISGFPLTMWCEREKLDTAGKITLFRKVLDGMAHAHGRGLVHRDLKPDNILVDTETGEPKVIDFGIARSTSTLLGDGALLTGQHDIMGTPAYLSPEQTDGGDAKIDARADIYALGAVLYELLTGKTPLAASGSLPESHFELLRAVREKVPPSPSELNLAVPGELGAVVMKAMAKDRGERYASIAEFDAALVDPPAVRVRRFSRRWLLLGLLVFPVLGLILKKTRTPEDVLDSFLPPFTLLERDYGEVENPGACIAPFGGANHFAWYRFVDADGEELAFAYGSRWGSPGSGEFIIGAISADLPGAVAVPPGSEADKEILEILEVSFDRLVPEAEREELERRPYSAFGKFEEDITGWKKKHFLGSMTRLYDLRKHWRDTGAW